MFETQFLDMEDRTPIISFRNADIINGEATVIYGLDMDVYPGDFVYIVGKVGTGKTSIIRTIIAENPLHKGRGEACGFELRDIRDKDIPYLRRKMGVVFQDFQLLMDRSVEEPFLINIIKTMPRISAIGASVSGLKNTNLNSIPSSLILSLKVLNTLLYSNDENGSLSSYNQVL